MIPPVEEIDNWLTDSESRLGVEPDVRKMVRWVDAARHDRTALAFSYIHGYTATRQECAPLCDAIAARFGANLYYTRLRGHGLDSDALRDVTLDHWMADVRQSVEVGQRIGQQQVLVASSTGATFAALMAVEGSLPESVKALIFLSPNYGPVDRRAEFITMPGGLALSRMLVGETREFDPVNEAHGRYWTRESPVEALIPMMQAVKRLRTRFETSHIRIPTLTFYCPHDTTVLASRTEEHADRYTHELSELVVVDDTTDPSHHILAGDILSPTTTDRLTAKSVEFVRAVFDRGIRT